ncbi:phytoene desaturase [Jatrophihabitans endophyticus]|uniref:Phytoene desaturase n=1 Tax=Jatrophihabitans endophyticus TaxID=1206085 RepID=A0A1M5L7B5_9ACTN|nr:phytoene desaturase family protein [Jatrophihabitans endophyticus]SHG60639.1 phytoene desaturase [Jatrophihabitans endophyticus]
MRTVPGPTDHVVIVGAGLGGLAAALHLAGSGRRVTVVEREAVPGGRCGLIADRGYRFDTGPTVLTMPELLAEAFAAVGESMADRLTLHRLDPAYRARFADGSSIDVRSDTDAMADGIATTFGARDADGYRRFVAFLHELYRIEMPHFIARNLDSPLQLVGTPLARLAAMGGFGRLDHLVARYVADDRLRRLFSFQAMYAGLAPSRALAIYAVITYMDCVRGVHFPAGGMHAVPRAMAAAAEDHGVEFRYGTTVTRVDVRAGRARGVITADGERIAADVVLVNADLPSAYAELLPPGSAPRRLRRLRYSPSAVVLHTGSTFSHPDAAHHTIDFGRSWDDTFTEIIDRGRVMSDPSFLVTSPSHTDPALAPAGRHTHYVLFPAPNLAGDVDWTGERERYRDHMVATLERRGYTGFGGAIEVEHLTTPADWRAQGMTMGAPFAAAHTFGQTGPFRAPTLDRRIDGLVFCGSNTQPGVGVPMVLVSGRLAAERVTGTKMDR